MDSKVPISDEKIYWYQLLISFCFGIAAYYILELLFPYGVSGMTFLHMASLWIVSGLYFGLLLGIPTTLLLLRNGISFFQGLKHSCKSFGTQLSLFILTAGLTFLINI
ncbi:MAG: hypothetical protein ACTSRS_11665 [Candidatus Helarchaeota archaeon]